MQLGGQKMATRDAVLSLFDTAKDEIDKQAKYYKERQSDAKWVSIGLRLLTAVFFALGSVAPLAAPFLEEGKYAAASTVLQAGYGSLAVAGLLLVLDQFFLSSKSWSRHTRAFLKLDFLSQALAFEKSCFELMAPDEATAHEKLDATLAKIAEYRAAHHAIVNDETGIWETDLAAAIAAFQTQVTSAKTGAQVAAEQKPAAVAVGTVEIGIEAELGNQIDSASLSIGDGQARPIGPPFTGPFVFENVPAGSKRIRLAGTLKGDKAPFLKELAAKIQADDITRVSLAGN